jgi:hypothetical protein
MISQSNGRCDILFIDVETNRQCSTSQSALKKTSESALCGERSAVIAPSDMDLITTDRNDQSTVSDKDMVLCFASGKVKKSERLAFRLSFADYQELKKLADKQDLPISAWLRDATLDTIQKQKTSRTA